MYEYWTKLGQYKKNKVYEADQGSIVLLTRCYIKNIQIPSTSTLRPYMLKSENGSISTFYRDLNDKYEYSGRIKLLLNDNFIKLENWINKSSYRLISNTNHSEMNKESIHVNNVQELISFNSPIYNINIVLSITINELKILGQYICKIFSIIYY